MTATPVFLSAALAEIAGCYCVWLWLKLHRSPWWLLPALGLLLAFAALLTRAEIANAGRAYAAYGGIYIATSLLWLWGVEGVRPSATDLGGALLCLLGTTVILLGARGGP